MIVEDQRALIDWLSSSDTHDLHGDSVSRIETHTALVFLAGAYAYKLKRAVRYDYLDYSTVDRRREACLAELRLNQRTAPSVYVDVLPITQADKGRFALNGSGTPVDWVVRMRRFDDDLLLDRLAARQALPLELMDDLAASVAALHASADRRDDRGGAAGIAWVIDGNADGLASEGRGHLDRDLCDAITTRAREELARQAVLLDRRRTQGFVRQCHGDLHLRNIVLLDGRPTLFDCVEFNDRIAVIDVLYDLAFLVMDLWHIGLKAHANRLLNAYLSPRDDMTALTLLPLFLSVRSAVRAMTSATAAGLQSDPSRVTELYQDASVYLRYARDFLQPAPARLLAIGGRSGTGKTTLARALAPGIGAPPGAVVLRSDAMRKALAGVGETDRLGAEHYTKEASAPVYAALFARAGEALRGGHSVILDAVFLDSRERDLAERVAADARVPFSGLWLEAPRNVLTDRVDRRRADASDATSAVVDFQMGINEGPMTWKRVDASGELPDVGRVLRTRL